MSSFSHFVNKLRNVNLNQVTQFLFGSKSSKNIQELSKQVINEFKNFTQPLNINIAKIQGIIANPEKYAETLDFIELTILEKMVNPAIENMVDFDPEIYNNYVAILHTPVTNDNGQVIGDIKDMINRLFNMRLIYMGRESEQRNINEPTAALWLVQALFSERPDYTPLPDGQPGIDKVMANEHQLRFAYEAKFGPPEEINPPMDVDVDENIGTYVAPRASMRRGPLPTNALQIPFPPGTKFDTNSQLMDESGGGKVRKSKKSRKSRKARKSKKAHKSRKTRKSRKHQKRH